MYQKRILPYFIFPSTFSPQASSLLERSGQTEGQTNLNTPFTLTSFFFPLSARGPTRRRNSTGLAELWGGWPIEQGCTCGRFHTVTFETVSCFFRTFIYGFLYTWG